MAQSSNALREPTMDEILNSIREIIEENTAQANQVSAAPNNRVRQVGTQSVVSQPANSQPVSRAQTNSRFAQQSSSQFAQQPNSQLAQPSNSQFAQQPNSQLAQPSNSQFAQQSNSQLAQQPNSQFAQQPNSQLAQQSNSQFAQQPNSQFAQQTDFSQQKSVTVDDAMQALAKRIGLTTNRADTQPTNLAANKAVPQQAYNEQFSRTGTFNKAFQPAIKPTEEVVHFFNNSSTQEGRAAEAVKTYNSVKTNQMNSEGRPTIQNKEYFADVKVTVQNKVSDLLEKTEAIAGQELRPALATWLDKQLPVLVERILREEISKVVKQLLLTKLS